MATLKDKKLYDETLERLTGTILGSSTPAQSTQAATPSVVSSPSSSVTRGLTVSGGENKGWDYDAYLNAGGTSASNSIPLSGYAAAPSGGSTYQSQYGDQIQSLLDRILNKEQFSYDFNADPIYQQYKDRYTQQGKLAMTDAMAQAAALTGGYGSSYGQQVGQQTFQGYMQGLNDIIPSLRDASYGQYADELSGMYNNASLLQGLDAADYAKWSDDRAYQLQLQQIAQAQANWQAEFDFAQQQYADSLKGSSDTDSGDKKTGSTYQDGKNWVASMAAGGASTSQIVAAVYESRKSFTPEVYELLVQYAGNYNKPKSTGGKGRSEEGR